jgi:hypothetical protein
MHRSWLTVLFFFITLYPVLGQDNALLPLKEILLRIEIQHNVKFNYLEADIQPYTLKPPPRTLILFDKIEYLRERTQLDFSFIDAKYITISARRPDANVLRDSVALSEILSEVVVSNYLARGITKKTDGSFILAPQKFGILPGLTEADVLQTMQQIPGIMSIDETISNINVRGGTHDQNLFNWNGIRMFQTGHFFGLISAFSPALPQEIRIYKNGTSAFYGESVSSAVDIVTKPESVRKTESGIGTNLISAECYTTVKLSDRTAFMASGRRSFTDLVLTPTYRNYTRRVFQNTIVTNLSSNESVRYASDEDFYFYDFSFQLKHKIGQRHELTASGIAISNALAIDMQKVESGQTVSESSDLQQQNYGGSLAWKTIWNETHASRASGYMSYYNLDATNRSIDNGQVLKQQNTVLDAGFKLEHSYVLNRRFLFNGGYQFNEIGIANYDETNAPVFYRDIKNVLRTHALVGEMQYSPEDNASTLKAGVRINYFEKFGKVLVEPRLQYSYTVSPLMRVEVLGEFKSQTASQVIDLQQDFLGLEKRRWTLADERENKIRQSQQFSIGFIFKKAGWLLTLENFYKKVTGISTTSQSFQNQLEFRKFNGDYTVYGIEFLVQKNFRKFYTWASYAFNDNTYTFNDFVPSNFDNNFEIQHTVVWAGIYEWNRLKIALGSRWYTGKPVTTPRVNFPIFGQINYNDPNNERLEDYFQVNFSAFYTWHVAKRTTLQFGISVLNLLNNRNVINRYYRVNTAENTIESVNTYSLERTPNVVAKITF